jgi:Amt family ammonium transporter
VTIITWYIWGYSLAFSPTATNGFIGNLDFGGHKNALGDPSPGSPLVPTLLYSLFQLEFCCVTVSILMGAIAERGRVMPAMLFTFFWVTLVYAPVACWPWNVNGWAFKWGVADYAGGGPVEIGSGMGGLAYSWVIGRRNERELVNFRPHNVTLVTLGTFMLWFGWIGFNAGSAFGANLRAVYAAMNTCIAAATGGITWCLVSITSLHYLTFVTDDVIGVVGLQNSTQVYHDWPMLWNHRRFGRRYSNLRIHSTLGQLYPRYCRWCGI